MKKPVIAIYDLGEKGVKYCDAIIRAGGKPRAFRFVDNATEASKIAECCDGLLLPGGGDAHPSLYGRPLKSWCGRIDDLRDKVELMLLKAFSDKQKPILGVCRGEQMINVYFGGTLIQDIESECPTAMNHYHDVNDGAEPYHTVKIAENSLLFDILKTDSIGTNSIHHQSVDGVAPDMIASGVTDDGIVEAIEHKELPFVLGIQWHPERLAAHNDSHFEIFNRFVKACEK